MAIYRHLQIGLVLLLVALFSAYIMLDILAYPLSEFARGTMAAIWSMILLLIDPKGLAEAIKTTYPKGATPDGKDTSAADSPEL